MEKTAGSQPLNGGALASLKEHVGFLELRKFMEQKVRTAVMKLKSPQLDSWQDVGFFRGRVKMCEEIDHLIRDAHNNVLKKGDK